MDIDYPGADDEDDDDDGVLPLQDFEACSMIEIQLGGQPVVVYSSAGQQCEWTMHQVRGFKTCSFVVIRVLQI